LPKYFHKGNSFNSLFKAISFNKGIVIAYKFYKYLMEVFMKQIHVSFSNRLFLFLFILLSFSLSYAQFAGGIGTNTSPFLLQTAQHVHNIDMYLSSSFKLINDIDLNVEPYNQNGGWNPIGSGNLGNGTFSGKFDGNGFTLSNLNINRALTDNQGLFQSTNNAILCNIKLHNINIIGQNRVGGLAGASDNTSVINCEIEGDIIGAVEVGGLLGDCFNSSLTNCHAYGTVNGYGFTGGLISRCQNSNLINCSSENQVTGDYYVGGLIGYNDKSNFTDCFSKSNVEGAIQTIYGFDIGGLVGYNGSRFSKFDRCYATGNVLGVTHFGGFIGHSNGAAITNCFSLGGVLGTGSYPINGTGGFIGYSGDNIITNCYSIGAVTGTNNLGGFIGYYENDATDTIVNSYWDIQISGQALSQGGEGRTTDEMTYPCAANTYVGWDFIATWHEDVTGLLNKGYPCLHDMPVTAIGDENNLPVPEVTMTNYPNPFNPDTTIQFKLPTSSKITLTIYNLKGQKIRTLANDIYSKGEQSFLWEGDTDAGKQAPCGMYLCKLKGVGLEVTRKLTLMK
jgi:hypothetical protein